MNELRNKLIELSILDFVGDIALGNVNDIKTPESLEKYLISKLEENKNILNEQFNETTSRR